MGIGTFCSVMGLGTMFAWFAWALILMNTSPKEAGLAGFLIFYVTLAVALIGTMTLIGTLVRIYLFRRPVPGREIRTAFRHGILFALVAIGSLALSAAGDFQPWYLIVFIAVATLVEYFFLQFHRGR